MDRYWNEATTWFRAYRAERRIKRIIKMETRVIGIDGMKGLLAVIFIHRTKYL